MTLLARGLVSLADAPPLWWAPGLTIFDNLTAGEPSFGPPASVVGANRDYPAVNLTIVIAMLSVPRLAFSARNHLTIKRL